MTVIFEQGDLFHIERVSGTITIEDAAGRYNSASIPLEKAGFFLGGMVTLRGATNTDAAENVGCWEIRNQSGSNISFGSLITGVTIRVIKAVSTAGNQSQTYDAIVFLRRKAV